MQLTGLGQVVNQDQLAWLTFQRAGCQRDPATGAQGYFVIVVFSGGKALLDQIPPQLPFQRFAEQSARRRVGLTHHATAIEDDHAARQQIKHILQAPGQARLFRQFAGALGLGISQLSPQLNHLLLKQRMRGAELFGHPLKALVSILQRSRIPLCQTWRWCAVLLSGVRIEMSLGSHVASPELRITFRGHSAIIVPQKKSFDFQRFGNERIRACQSSDASAPRLRPYLRIFSTRVVRRIRRRSAARATTPLHSSSAC